LGLCCEQINLVNKFKVARYLTLENNILMILFGGIFGASYLTNSNPQERYSDYVPPVAYSYLGMSQNSGLKCFRWERKTFLFFSEINSSELRDVPILLFVSLW
jgi:hypothetical protein